MGSSFTMGELVEDTLPVWSTSPIPPSPSWWFWLKVIPFTSVVSLASALAVMVVGKNTVAVPLLVFFGEPPLPALLEPAPPGDIMVKGETGILPIFVISSMKLELLPNGELTMLAEVGSP